MSDDVKIVRPDAPRDVVSQQGPKSKEPRRYWEVRDPAADARDAGLLHWLIAHCELHAKLGYGKCDKDVVPLWLERAEHLRRILRRKYGDNRTAFAIQASPNGEKNG